jgi:hypothetical protein
MLDSKSHSPKLFARAAACCAATATFSTAELLAQLSNFCNQLSIFPTTTLPFVILSLEKKAHASNSCSEQSFD